ncbi:MAG: hypothetical protein AAB229_00065, partial [Candidatus Hydrogenedentota bacterium]
MLKLKARVRELIARGFETEVSDGEFNELALAIHAHQAAHCAEIGRVSPTRPSDWRNIPLVPTSLFSRFRLAAFPPDNTFRVFRSSGTTASTRSAHHFDDLDLYRAASMAGARWALGEGSFDVRSLVTDDPESSLACMATWLREDLSSLATSRRLVLGSAFSFVPMIDKDARDPLPAGSVVIETGGYKGRSREISRSELHAGISRIHDVSDDRIISEYGMCELSSPLWQQVGDPRVPDERLFRSAGWTRIRIVDPETGEDAEEGLIGILDLANVHSCVGILTGDRGRLEGNEVR